MTPSPGAVLTLAGPPGVGKSTAVEHALRFLHCRTAGCDGSIAWTAGSWADFPVVVPGVYDPRRRMRGVDCLRVNGAALVRWVAARVERGERVLMEGDRAQSLDVQRALVDRLGFSRVRAMHLTAPVSVRAARLRERGDRKSPATLAARAARDARWFALAPNVLGRVVGLRGNWTAPEIARRALEDLTR